MLYLIRGLPGVGKSTLACRLSQCVLSADQFFIVDGIYQYDASKIKDAHEWCQSRTKERLASGWDPVVVANTFVQRWQLDPYYELGLQYHKTTIELTVQNQMTDEELAKRCIHGVSVETIARMRAQWEH